MTKQELLLKAKTEGEIHADYTVEKIVKTFLPFFNKGAGSDVMRAYAHVYRMKHAINDDHYHNVVVACREDGEFFHWCGDTYLNGEGKRTSAEARRAVKKIAKSASEEQEMLSHWGQYYEEPCRFWRDKTCSHTNHVFTLIDEEMLDDLSNSFKKTGKLVQRSTEELLEKYSFKKHVLLQGDKGAGKTHGVFTFVQENKLESYFIGGSESTEACDMIGEYIPMSIGSIEKKGQASLFESSESSLSMVWKDGPLSKAFRSARDGKKTVLIIDEMLRIPQRELSPLVSALTPTPSNTYILGTRRAVGVVDGIAVEETIEAPCENFWVVSTTNIGASYAVEDIDEAFADRFRLIHVAEEESKTKKILKDAALSKGYAITVADSLLEFKKVYDKRRADGAFSKICNTRQLKEAIINSVDYSDVVETLWETRFAWIDFDIDGQPLKEQEDELKKLFSRLGV